MDYLPANSLCAKHEKLRAVAVCSRCGRFLCSDCVQLGTGKELCEACFVMRPTESASWFAVAAALTGFPAMALFPFGLVAITLAVAGLGRAGLAGPSRGTWVLSAVAILQSLIGFGVAAYAVLRPGQ